MKETITNATNLALAQTEYLDVSRPKPRISILALKYDLSPSYLMRMSIKQDWDGLRNKAETQAALQVTPEVRRAVVGKIDGVILRNADGIASKVLDAYSRLIDEVAELKTEGSEEAVIEDADLAIATPASTKREGSKAPKGPKRPSLSSKISMLNDATSGISTFMKAFQELGLTLNPEPEKVAGGTLKNAIPVNGCSTPAIPPPPIEVPPTVAAPETSSKPTDLPPPPPV